MVLKFQDGDKCQNAAVSLGFQDTAGILNKALTTGQYWLASRTCHYYVAGSNYHYWSIATINVGETSGSFINPQSGGYSGWDSGWIGNSSGKSFPLCPVVVLDKSLCKLEPSRLDPNHFEIVNK